MNDRNGAAPSPRPLANGLIRVGAAVEIPGILRELGADPAPILAEAGIEEAFLAEPDNLLPFRTLGRLIALCVSATGCDHFGLLIGQRAGASSLGVVGFLVQQAPDVRAALDDLVRYLHFHDRGAVPRLAVEGGLALLSYGIYERNAESADQISDGAIAIGQNLMKGLCGPDWRPDEVLLPRRRPADVAPYRAFFDAPLRFDADQAALAFSARWLDRPLPQADPNLRRFLREHMQEPAAGDAEGASEDIRRVVRAILGTTHPSGANVARLLNLSRRTLSRRLKLEGTDFRQLSEEVRYSTARQLLEATQLPLAHIAAKLQYSEASAFSRAFKRWSGLSPREWRTREAGTSLDPKMATNK
jgi:AraC-like DNA-binding protein